MAELYIRGITTLKVGEILPDGGMATTLASLGSTFEGTARLETADPTINDFFSEESDNPILTTTVGGKTTLVWNIVDFTATVLEQILGGTPAGTTWPMPAAYPSIELSIEIVTRSGVTIQIPRASIAGKILADLSKNSLGQVQITATVLTPTLEALAPLSILPTPA